MTKKLRLGLIFGGKSAEHEVSLISARNVAGAIDKEKYEVVLIGIAKDGSWRACAANALVHDSNNPKLLSLDSSGAQIATISDQGGTSLVDVDKGENLGNLDVVFPVLHGTYGEDGTVQGLLKLANVPFVGPSVLGSAIGMDKDVAKRLLRDAGIPVAKFITVTANKRKNLNFEEVQKELGLPLFIKPANCGSSVGVSKAKDKASFEKGVDDALQFDRKILIEEAIVGKEVECSVLGNEDPIASLPGIIITDPKHEFYSYDAKYVDENGASVEIPANISPDQIKLIQDLSVKTFKTLELEGMARVDFFLTPDGRALVNEVNTIPGFTNISMYPKMWQASGLPYKDLIQKLIDLAIERFKRDGALKTAV